MRLMILLPLLALLTACDHPGGKGYTIDSQTPAQFYQNYVDQGEQCKLVVNANRDADVKLVLHKDNTFTMRYGSDDTELKGNWYISGMELHLVNEGQMVAALEPVRGENSETTVLRLAWHQEELGAATQSPIVIMGRGEQNTCQGVQRKTVPVDDNTNIDIDVDLSNNTIDLVTPPKYMKTKVTVDSLNSDFKAMVDEQDGDVFAVCGELADALKSESNLDSTLSTLEKKAGIVIFEITETYPQKLYDGILEEAKKQDPSRDFKFLPENTQLDEEAEFIEESLVSLMKKESLQKYTAIEDEENTFELNIAQYCDLAGPDVKHFGFWQTGDREATRLPLELNVDALSE